MFTKADSAQPYIYRLFAATGNCWHAVFCGLTPAAMRCRRFATQNSPTSKSVNEGFVLAVSFAFGPSLTRRGCEFFVGCDQRSEFEIWCAGAGNHRSS
jgi:hypothetical protein